MRVSLALLATLPAAQGIKIIQGNDDGWAIQNIRVLYNVLTHAGHSTFISAPAEDQSGRGSLDAPPATVDSDGCEFKSCAPGSPAYGFNASQPRFNYVNSYPVTAIKYGLQNLSSRLLDGRPDLMLSGPNAGSNMFLAVQVSGTVGAAVEAVKEGVPAIAFSGATDDRVAWDEPAPGFAKVYADLSLNVTDAIVASGKPYLPARTFLNVNFPVSNATQCASAASFRFVLSRINPHVPLISGNDVETCGNDVLPTEEKVSSTPGCYASISVGDSDDKTTASGDKQAVVLKKLRHILSCLP